MRKLILLSSLALFLSFSGLFSQGGWIAQNSGISEKINQVYFLNYSLGFAACQGGKLLITYDGGSVWQRLYTFDSDVKKIKFYNHITGVAFTVNGTYRTTNNGINWMLVSTAANAADYTVTGENLTFAVYEYNGNILKSTDLGYGWGGVYPLSGNAQSISFVNPNTGYAANYYSGSGNTVHSINKTTNGGIQWSLFYSVTLPLNSGRSGDLFFTSADTGYYSLKTNNGNFICSYRGAFWEHYAVSSFQNGLHFINSKTGWSAGEYGSIYKTTNAGVNWFQNNTPTTYNLTGIQFVNDNTGWASGENGVILKTTNAGITFVTPVSNLIPRKFSLSQNYPNPFNPVTNIKFEIPETGHVKLVIYDVLGKEVETLVNEELSPGTYNADFNASGLPSGVYYYRIEAGSYTEFKKMVLIK